MATYIVLGQFTEQGIKNVKKTTERAKAIQELAKMSGITVKEIYWTLGHHDVVMIAEAPDDESATAFFLSAAAQGNVRTQSLRAFSAAEMDRILSKTT
ncbi:MAG: GYD domain-containing protein [Isosphaeraceae bacterium]